ncbi:protein YABBY 2-like [Zingiber officinale]|uniref:Uncharacterized protein n=1 Tax=Zingiber officinale TaxID=94328 RepID=A0A8J5FDY1_ZINOF|nr:protein YABBY 2-like [Zingiber officinale]KAG6483291.1 hypothetical protein ZIOFF_059935 [Zingiber officinale]
MATQIVPEQVCYLQCNLCNTILAVSVPRNSLFHLVTVRCGHCANLLYVNMGAFSQAFPLDQQLQNLGSQSSRIDLASSSKYDTSSLMYSLHDDRQIITLHPPQKRQRVPSAYNRFIREEIQRIKASNPDISHKEAFGAAAKNWAHLPHIHLGLTLEGSDQQVNMEEGIGATTGGGDPKGPAGFY